MSKRTWLFILAFGITVGSQSVAQQSPDQPVDQHDESNGQQQGQDSATPPGIPIRILEEPDQSESAKREQAEAAQREIDDLIAQQLAAKAAEWSYKVGIAQTVIAFFGTMALIYSLNLNRIATNAAVRGANAAQNSVDIAREIGNKQLRPWVLSKGPAIFEAQNSRHPSGVVADTICFRCTWFNDGQSPGINAEIYMDFRVIPAGGPLPVFSSTPRVGTVPIPLKTMVYGATNGIIGDNRTNFLSGTVELVIFSRVDYSHGSAPNVRSYSEATFRCRADGEEKDTQTGQQRTRFAVSPEGPQSTIT